MEKEPEKEKSKKKVMRQVPVRFRCEECGETIPVVFEYRDGEEPKLFDRTFRDEKHLHREKTGCGGKLAQTLFTHRQFQELIRKLNEAERALADTRAELNELKKAREHS